MTFMLVCAERSTFNLHHEWFLWGKEVAGGGGGLGQSRPRLTGGGSLLEI